LNQKGEPRGGLKVKARWERIRTRRIEGPLWRKDAVKGVPYKYTPCRDACVEREERSNHTTGRGRLRFWKTLRGAKTIIMVTKELTQKGRWEREATRGG